MCVCVLGMVRVMWIASGGRSMAIVSSPLSTGCTSCSGVMTVVRRDAVGSSVVDVHGVGRLLEAYAFLLGGGLRLCLVDGAAWMVRWSC